MTRSDLVAELASLFEEGRDIAALRSDPGGPPMWHGRAKSAVTRAVGEGRSDLMLKLMTTGTTLSLYSSRADPYAQARTAEAVGEILGCLETAIYELKEVIASEDFEGYAGPDVIDDELWNYVDQLIEAEDWSKVASQTAIFVEHKIREWSQLSGKYGKDLFAMAFADDSELRLGKQRSEWEGWRSLAVGFVQIGNISRHNIQERADARRYAVGVLGLASLLLTQVKHEHPELVAARTAKPKRRAWPFTRK